MFIRTICFPIQIRVDYWYIINTVTSYNPVQIFTCNSIGYITEGTLLLFVLKSAHTWAVACQSKW